jgi:N-acetylglucosamine-6-phosphate deacetylase
MRQVHAAEKIFTGEEWVSDHAIIVEDNIIQEILSKENIPSGADVINYATGFVAPSFIDIQIYGAYGSLLSIHPAAQTLQKIRDYCKSGGADHFQPTVATNTYEVFYKCIDTVKDYWNQGGQGVIGLHVEGPWINKAKRGAHIEEYIHSPAIEQAKALLEYGKGVITMITLAPEVCSSEVIDLVHSYGVIVSAGHSDATFQEANDGFSKGIYAATHLYNAMSPLQHRAPGMAGAIMNHEDVRSSIVPDGYHVDFAALSIAKKVMKERLFFITDAVTETNEGPYPHQRDGDKYVSKGILSGSALTMAKSVKNCVEKAGIELSEALRMASLYPAQVMRLDNKLGKIAKGYKAAFAVMSDELEVR